MSYLIAAIAIMTLVTYLTRVIPLIFVNKPIKSAFLRSFLFYIPYAVLAAMTFPAIFYATGNEPSNIAVGVIGALAAIVMSYFNRSLLQVSVITVILVYVLALYI